MFCSLRHECAFCAMTANQKNRIKISPSAADQDMNCSAFSDRQTEQICGFVASWKVVTGKIWTIPFSLGLGCATQTRETQFPVHWAFSFVVADQFWSKIVALYRCAYGQKKQKCYCFLPKQQFGAASLRPLAPLSLLPTGLSPFCCCMQFRCRVILGVESGSVGVLWNVCLVEK